MGNRWRQIGVVLITAGVLAGARAEGAGKDPAAGEVDKRVEKLMGELNPLSAANVQIYEMQAVEGDKYLLTLPPGTRYERQAALQRARMAWYSLTLELQFGEARLANKETMAAARRIAGGLARAEAGLGNISAAQDKKELLEKVRGRAETSKGEAKKVWQRVEGWVGEAYKVAAKGAVIKDDMDFLDAMYFLRRRVEIGSAKAACMDETARDEAELAKGGSEAEVKAKRERVETDRKRLDEHVKMEGLLKKLEETVRDARTAGMQAVLK